MKRSLITILVLVVLVATTNCFAAFPVPAAANISSPVNIATGKKAFIEREVPHFLSSITKAVGGEDDKKSTHLTTHKTGWQGLLASGLTVLALLTGSLPFALLLGTGALVFGIIGLNKAYHTNTGFAVVGVIVGSIIVVIGFVLLLTTATVLV